MSQSSGDASEEELVSRIVDAILEKAEVLDELDLEGEDPSTVFFRGVRREEE